MKKSCLPLIVTGLCLGLGPGANADVKLPAIFGDHMVLQQEATLPVWGWASPGETVTVSFAGRQTAVTAGADGKWRADLPAVPGGAGPGTLTVTGHNTVACQDVLVGDVWVCSGQSNMEFPTRVLEMHKPGPADASDSQIRLFHVGHQLAMVPLEDVPSGSWQVCSPETVREFSAVGFFFARELRPVLKRPLGLIEAAEGATNAAAWTSIDGLRSNPLFKRDVDEHDLTQKAYPGGEPEFEAQAAAFQAETKAYKDRIAGDPDYQNARRAWGKARLDAMAAGMPAPPEPTPPSPGLRHFPPGIHHNAPGVLFDTQINPIIPFAIKGVIWYQGENDTTTLNAATHYRALLTTLITDWRAHWKEGDFPFLFVQLAGFTANPRSAGDVSLWALLREAQLQTLSLPQTGMAVAADIGSVGNIHPPDKFDVGRRLALAARHVAYGEKIVYTGPVYRSFQVVGSAVRITFQPDSLGSGLMVGSTPCADPKATPASKTDLQGFAVAGEDRKWFWATAKIEQNMIMVTSPDVPKPVAVRYAWATNPVCNLYNKEGLPASPFRTDDWPTSSEAAAQAAKITQ